MLTLSVLIGFFSFCLALAEDKGEKVFDDACSPCHSASVRPLDNIRMTKEQWKETIDRMIDLGAEVPKSKKAELLEYLSRTHGPAGNK